MITLILATFLAAPAAPVTTAQFRPCVWPNTCSSVEAPVAQFQPCVWPNRCASQPAVIAAGPVTTCVWPNVCSASL